MDKKQEEQMLAVSGFIETLRSMIIKLNRFIDDWRRFKKGGTVWIRIENTENLAMIELPPEIVGKFLIPAFKSISKAMEGQIDESPLPGVAVSRKVLPKSKKKKAQRKKTKGRIKR